MCAGCRWWGRRACGGVLSGPSPHVEVSGARALGSSGAIIAAVSWPALPPRPPVRTPQRDRRPSSCRPRRRHPTTTPRDARSHRRGRSRLPRQDPPPACSTRPAGPGADTPLGITHGHQQAGPHGELATVETRAHQYQGPILAWPRQFGPEVLLGLGGRTWSCRGARTPSTAALRTLRDLDDVRCRPPPGRRGAPWSSRLVSISAHRCGLRRCSRSWLVVAIFVAGLSRTGEILSDEQ